MTPLHQRWIEFYFHCKTFCFVFKTKQGSLRPLAKAQWVKPCEISSSLFCRLWGGGPFMSAPLRGWPKARAASARSWGFPGLLGKSEPSPVHCLAVGAPEANRQWWAGCLRVLPARPFRTVPSLHDPVAFPDPNPPSKRASWSRRGRSAPPG